MILAARMRETLGLPGMTVEETVPFRDKEKMKQVLDAAGIRSAEPLVARQAVGGLFIPGHGAVSPIELTRALVTAARRHGAQVLEQGRARRITRTSTELVVETERGSLSGDRSPKNPY